MEYKNPKDGCARANKAEVAGKYLAYTCNDFVALQPPKRTTLHDLINLGNSFRAATAVEAWDTPCEGSAVGWSLTPTHFVEDLVTPPYVGVPGACEVNMTRGGSVRIRARRSRPSSAKATLRDTRVYNTYAHPRHAGYEVRAYACVASPSDEFTFCTEMDASDASCEVSLKSRPQPHTQSSRSTGAPASPQQRPFSARPTDMPSSAHASQRSLRQGQTSRPMSAPSARTTSVWAPWQRRMSPCRMGTSGGWYGVAKASRARLRTGGNSALQVGLADGDISF